MITNFKYVDARPVMLTLDEVERLHIEESLIVYCWNYSRTAKDLGVSRGKLYRMIKKHGIVTNRSVSAG